jgi:hypothetical protein
VELNFKIFHGSSEPKGIHQIIEKFGLTHALLHLKITGWFLSLVFRGPIWVSKIEFALS